MSRRNREVRKKLSQIEASLARQKFCCVFRWALDKKYCEAKTAEGWTWNARDLYPGLAEKIHEEGVEAPTCDILKDYVEEGDSEYENPSDIEAEEAAGTSPMSPQSDGAANDAKASEPDVLEV